MRIAKTTALLTLVGVGLSASAVRASLVTSFETPGYTSGTIIGQQGWTGNSTTAAYNLANVSTAHPKTGSQGLTLTDVPANAANPSYGPELISPNTGTGTGATTTSVAFDIVGGAPGTFNTAVTHNIYLVSDAAADVDLKYGFNDYVGGISLQDDGSIDVESYTSDFGGYMSLAATGATWTPNTYHTLGITVDPATQDMKYFYDGVQIADTQAFYEQTVGNVVFRNDSNNVGETITYDDLSVTNTPEPAALGTLALLGLLGARRRRA